ncbi:MAG: TolC family protein [Xanthomonadaceae bacterium]|nr:TolC family protein [Xanthomonadaceae bacterium]
MNFAFRHSPGQYTIVPMPMRLLVAVLLVLFLNACASVSSTQPLDPVRSAAALDARRLDDSAVLAALQRAGIAVPVGAQGWTLDALTVAAWQLRPELAQARAGRIAADADITAASRRPNPVLSFTPEWIANAPVGASSWIAALLVSQVFASPDKRSARIDQARARFRQALWQQAQIAWDLRAQVRTSALELRLAEGAARLAVRVRSLRYRWLELTERRVSAGVLPEAERERARLLALQDEAQARVARQAVVAARAQLAAAVGVRADALADVLLQLPAVDEVGSWQPPGAADLREAAVFNRVDLAQALAAYDETEAAWRETVARKHPDLTLGPGYTYDVGDRKLVLAMSAEVPVNDRHDAAIASAQAHREAAARHVEAVQAQAMATLDQAQLQVQATSRALRAAQAGMALQERLLTRQRELRRAGSSDHIGVVLAQLEALQGRRDVLAALRALAAAMSALEAAVQRPLWPSSALAPVAAIAGESTSQDVRR